jgi:hypothetical protein
MAAAKLLTGNERRVVTAVDLRPASGVPGLAFLAVFVFSVLLLRHGRLVPGFGSWFLILAGRRPAPAWAPCAAKFIRPPPRLR